MRKYFDILEDRSIGTNAGGDQNALSIRYKFPRTETWTVPILAMYVDMTSEIKVSWVHGRNYEAIFNRLRLGIG